MNQQFFEKIFPTQGNVCIAGIDKEGIIKPKFATSVGDAIALAQRFIDIQHNVYFTPGTYEGLRRKQENCIYVKAFFLDLDVEHGKDRYPSKADALQDLQRFCDEINWPQPILIDSGGGIHAYWIFDEEMPAEKWVPYAEKFKQLCTDHNLIIDQNVPADSARLMRVPGTSNYRYDPPTPSVMLTDVYTYSFDRLAPALGEIEEKFDLRNVEKGLDEDTQAIYDKLNGNFEYDFQKIAVDSLEGNGCAQIKYILEEQADCPEPLWYAGLSVAARCRDGATAIHGMSDEHPNYTWDETERKAEQSKREAAWSHSCDAFAKENPSGCVGCPHRSRLGKVGPIGLGKVIKIAEHTSYEQIDGEPNGSTSGQTEDQEESVRQEPNTKEIFFPDYLQPYFRGVNGGIYVMPPPRRDKKGKLIQDDPELLSPFDVYPIQRIYSPHDGECLVMRIDFPKDESREFILPLKDVGLYDKLKTILLSNGLKFEPASAPKMASYIMKWSTYLTNVRKAEVMRMQQGWTSEKCDSFVIGTTEYMADGTTRQCPPSPLVKNIVRNIRPNGTLEDWKKSISMFGDPGYEWHAFSVLCGFASPLMEFTNVNGVILSLYGKSGFGKTGALYGALSIWGHPENLAVFDATQNALITRMIACKNLPFGLDEQSNTDGKILSHVAYNVSSGQPKLRMQASTNQEREASFITKLISVITTNTRLRDAMSQYKGDTNPEEMRILEPIIQRPNVAGYELTDERGMLMFETLKSHFGHAGPLYIQELFRITTEEVKRRATKEYLNVGEKYTKNAEYRFLSNLVAITRVAGNITNNMGLTNFDLDRIFAVVGVDFEKIIDGKQEEDDSKAESVLGDFINKNIQNTLVIRDGRVVADPKQALYIRAEVDENTIWVSSAAMKEYLKTVKLGTTWFESELTRKGILKHKDRKQMASGWKSAFGSTNIQAYRIVMDISHLFQDEQEAISE